MENRTQGQWHRSERELGRVVIVFYLCVTYYPQVRGLKQYTLSHTHAMGQESRSVSAGRSVSGFLVSWVVISPGCSPLRA